MTATLQMSRADAERIVLALDSSAIPGAEKIANSIAREIRPGRDWEPATATVFATVEADAANVIICALLERL